MDRPTNGSPEHGEQPDSTTDLRAGRRSCRTDLDPDQAGFDKPAAVDPRATGESGDAIEYQTERIDASRTLIYQRFDPGNDSLAASEPAASEPAAVISDKTASSDSELITDKTDARETEVVPVTALTEPALTEPALTEPALSKPAQTLSTSTRRGDPVRHGLVMITTVFIMLAAARFVLPGVIEELRYAQRRGQLRAEFEVAGQGLRDVSLDTLSQAYQMVSAAAGPSVVHIDIHRTMDDSVKHPELPGAPSMLISDQGSGVVVDRDGYILTNRHVVFDSEEISVTLSDGRVVDASVIGADAPTDLALLKVDADNLIPIRWGDSESIQVGSPVWAIGSPFGLDRTVTFGILSGKHRVVRAKDRYQDFMQSDVAVNPGNSGGPLVDARGTMVGVNTAIVGDTYQGVSFAIPSVLAKKIYQNLRQKGEVQRGWLGVSLAEVPDNRLHGDNYRVRGAQVLKLADQRSGAARAGIRPGDIVLQVDQEEIRDVNHLMQVIGNAMAGTRINLTIARDEQEMSVDVTLGTPPEQRF